MAKKRKKKGGSRGRRRSVGGIKAGSPLMNMLTISAGLIGGNMAAKMLPESMSDKIKGAIMVGAGYFLPKVAKGPMFNGLAMGIAAGGVLKVAQGFGIVNGIGIGSTPMIGAYHRSRSRARLNGPTAMVAGTSAQVAGVGSPGLTAQWAAYTS